MPYLAEIDTKRTFFSNLANCSLTYMLRTREKMKLKQRFNNTIHKYSDKYPRNTRNSLKIHKVLFVFKRFQTMLHVHWSI